MATNLFAIIANLPEYLEFKRQQEEREEQESARRILTRQRSRQNVRNRREGIRLQRERIAFLQAKLADWNNKRAVRWTAVLQVNYLMSAVRQYNIAVIRCNNIQAKLDRLVRDL